MLRTSQKSLRQADTWEPWQDADGQYLYEKCEIDILLADGRVVYVCWPNAGTATDLLHEHRTWGKLPYEQILFWRPSKHEQRFEERMKDGD